MNRINCAETIVLKYYYHHLLTEARAYFPALRYNSIIVIRHNT